MRPDTTLRCADCGGELGMLVVMRGYLRLGHKHAPATIHPPRLAPAPRSRENQPFGELDGAGSGTGSRGSGAPDRTRAHGVPPRTARRTQEVSLPPEGSARTSPRRAAAPASARLPEPSAG